MINFHYLPSKVFIVLTLVELRKSLKQIISIKHNGVKNPNITAGRQTSWLFYNLQAVEDLASGLL